MRSYTEAEICLLLLYALPGQNLRESLYRKLFRAFAALGDGNRSPEAQVDRDALCRLGCSDWEAEEILYRLDQRDLLDAYLRNLWAKGIEIVTRISTDYPHKLRMTLGDRAPLVLYCGGNTNLFSTECISLVGSRQLREKGKAFASTAGDRIAALGYTYCSGGAAGADTLGYRAATNAGGNALVFVADSLEDCMHRRMYQGTLDEGRLLLVSEYGFDQAFSPQRALSRNRLIHAMGEKTLVAQSDYGVGGTWNGTLENLKHGWSPVLVCSEEPEDPGTRGLIERGGTPVLTEELCSLDCLGDQQMTIL